MVADALSREVSLVGADVQALEGLNEAVVNVIERISSGSQNYGRILISSS